jgi:hypothetical protein
MAHGKSPICLVVGHVIPIGTQVMFYKSRGVPLFKWLVPILGSVLQAVLCHFLVATWCCVSKRILFCTSNERVFQYAVTWHILSLLVGLHCLYVGLPISKWYFGAVPMREIFK